MLNGLPFHAKWQVNAGGITTFGDDEGQFGTDLIAYEVQSEGWDWDLVALQLVCAYPGAAKPGDLPFMCWNPTGGEFAQLEAIGYYPDEYTQVMALSNGGANVQLENYQFPSQGVLGNWQGLGFGYCFGEIPAAGSAYTVINLAASASYLRAGLQGAGADYAWASLNGEDYSNLQLRGAKFAYADLTNTLLAGSNLAGATFTNVLPLTGTTLNGCNLTGASFSNVDLSGKDFNGATMDGIVVDGANLENATFLAVNKVGVSLTNVDFRKVKSIKGAQFTGADLAGCNFAGVDLTGVDFGGTSLQGASFAGCDLTVAKFSSPPTLSTSRLALTGFSDAKLDYTLIGLDWSYLNLTRANIVGLPAALDGLQAVWANLGGLVLKEMSITGANFNDATLQNLVLAQSDLSRSTFISAHLEGDTTIPSATLTSCTLMDVDFTGANLTNVDLSNAYFHGSKASLKEATILLAIFANAYLTGVDFSGVINADFQGVTFTDACLVNASFKDCNIADYVGRPTTFAGACLHGADFSGASVTGCDLFDAAVAATSGTIVLTLPVKGVPIPIPTAYNATRGLAVATNNSTVCPNGEHGPCTAADLVAPHPPTAWP